VHTLFVGGVFLPTLVIVRETVCVDFILSYLFQVSCWSWCQWRTRESWNHHKVM